MNPAALCEQNDLFISGEDGYHTYRIPALAVSARGTVLAFCEAHKYNRSDAGEIHLALRRSTDNGRTWDARRILVTDGDMTCGNPCPVVDGRTGTIWLAFCKNLGDGDQHRIMAGHAPRTVWLTHSDDDGLSWAEPQEITAAVKAAEWTWYATGPGHGIQLASGRLVIPCDHVAGTTEDFYDPAPRHSHVIYSDDGGQTWRIGGIAQAGTNECAVVETGDGRLYLNARNYRPDAFCRAVAWSANGGLTFSRFAEDDTLIEPRCQASLTRFTTAQAHGRSRVVFANPASRTERAKLRLRLSYDDGTTWPIAKMLNAGPSAYSDLAVAPDMTILCFYERGTAHPYERLTLARVNLAWLTEGHDTLT